MVKIKDKMLCLIALTEILIGGITLLTLLSSLFSSVNTKTPNVLAFVFLTACTSATLGAGLLQSDKRAYELLIYFSSIIILSKVLIFADIIQLNGALETSISPTLKNIVSIFYHAFVIVYLKKKDIKTLFRN